MAQISYPGTSYYPLPDSLPYQGSGDHRGPRPGPRLTKWTEDMAPLVPVYKSEPERNWAVGTMIAQLRYSECPRASPNVVSLTE